MHYAHVERWRQAALRYQANYGASYFDDVLSVYRSLGLAVNQGRATIFPTLTPFKEKETHIMAPALDDDLKSALYRLLQAFVGVLGVHSFNVALYQPPLADTPEDWAGFPLIVRAIDRGDLEGKTADIGAMEIFGQSVVATDPFRVTDAVRNTPVSMLAASSEGDKPTAQRQAT
jgi:hypothetical protein